MFNPVVGIYFKKNKADSFYLFENLFGNMNNLQNTSEFFLHLISPPKNFFAQKRVLLKTFGFSLRCSRALNVPLAETELADGADVVASGAEFSAEQPA